MRILVDMDEVQTKFVARILEWYNQDHGTDFKPEDMKDFEMKLGLGPGSEAYIRLYMRYDRFWDDLEPVQGAIEGMRTLVEAGHDVMIATAVPKCAGSAYEGKVQWVRRHLPFFNLDNFVAIKRKDVLAADVLFDDGEHNLNPWFLKYEGFAVAMDRPWNQSAKCHYRVKTWPEFVQLIKDIENGKCFFFREKI